MALCSMGGHGSLPVDIMEDEDAAKDDEDTSPFKKDERKVFVTAPPHTVVFLVTCSCYIVLCFP